tara:strand:- start:161 stop:649 length:489 start_codon:yes stop_codon:yes gene_type:complete
MKIFKNRYKGKNYKSLTRLAVVQAVYRKNFGHVSFEKIVEEFTFGDLFQAIDEKFVDMIDWVFFENLLKGEDLNKEKIKDLIRKTLHERSLKKMELVLSSIIRVAVCELLIFSNVPARVIIDEYVKITTAFFDGDQSSLTNGVLDKLARELRGDEFKNFGTA